MKGPIEELCSDALVRFVYLVASRLMCEPDRDQILDRIYALTKVEPEKARLTIDLDEPPTEICETHGGCQECRCNFEEMSPVGYQGDVPVRICNCDTLYRLTADCAECRAVTDKETAAEDAYQSAKEEVVV